MRPSILRARIVLFVTVVVVAIAQQVDYNTQVRNRPVTHVVATGQTLASAVAALPAGGVLTIPSGTYTISTTVSVPQNNVTFQCQPGAQINAGANNIETFDITGAGVWFTGCLFDGNSHTGVRFLTADGATADNFTATWNTFQNSAFASASYAFGVQDISGSGLTLNHNRYLNMGGGVQFVNTDSVDIQDEYFFNIGQLRAIGGAIAYNTFARGATVYINNNTGDTFETYGIEVTSPGIRSIVVTNNSFTNLTQDGASIPMCFHLQSCQNESTIIKDNTFIGNSSSNGYAIEAYGNGLQVTGNTITGPFGLGILWQAPGEVQFGRPGAIISWNYISGTLGGINTNGGGGLSDYCLMEGNNFYNNRDYAITFSTAAPGCKILHNQDFRPPGGWTGDSSRIYTAFVAVDTVGSPMLFEGNYAVVLPPLNGYTLPGTMLWSGLRSSNTTSAAYPATFRDNVLENRNATAFGQRFYGTSDSFFANASIIGNKYINLAAPAAFTEYTTSAAINYRDNQTLAGLGGSPYTDFTIATLTYAKRGGTLNGTGNYFTDGACTAGTLAGSGSGSSGRLTNGSWTCP